MGQKKLIKFAAIKEYNNVLEFPQDMQGKWAAFFDALDKGTKAIDIANLSISHSLVSPNISSDPWRKDSIRKASIKFTPSLISKLS